MQCNEGVGEGIKALVQVVMLSITEALVPRLLTADLARQRTAAASVSAISTGESPLQSTNTKTVPPVLRTGGRVLVLSQSTEPQIYVIGQQVATRDGHGARSSVSFQDTVSPCRQQLVL